MKSGDFAERVRGRPLAGRCRVSVIVIVGAGVVVVRVVVGVQERGELLGGAVAAARRGDPLLDAVRVHQVDADPWLLLPGQGHLPHVGEEHLLAGVLRVVEHAARPRVDVGDVHAGQRDEAVGGVDVAGQLGVRIRALLLLGPHDDVGVAVAQGFAVPVAVAGAELVVLDDRGDGGGGDVGGRGVLGRAGGGGDSGDEEPVVDGVDNDRGEVGGVGDVLLAEGAALTGEPVALPDVDRVVFLGVVVAVQARGNLGEREFEVVAGPVAVECADHLRTGHDRHVGSSFYR